MLVIQRPTVEPIGSPENNRQKFSVGPLEPGLGHTIGNSLRRMLLSSIPGAAIVSVKFESALHEFDTIEGVTQDVTEIILNLKDIVLQSTSSDPVVLSVDAKGPMELTAGDIQCPPEVEILNKSQKIATLSAKGKLVFELTVEQGKGYMSSDRDGARKTIGIIPIDAIFSPIRRVTFEVVPTRVEQSTNYDNLILDIETDGSIAPVDALASAGATLRSLVDLVANLTAEPVALELGEVSGYSSGTGDLDMPIEDLDLSERPRNCLKRGQVNTIGELLTRSEEDLMNITNFGQKSLDEIKQKLDERGLSLRV
ncbi:MAG: DNA-directed RNA polymerase subunit alpha [Ilumatobacteraceae bacterium]|jgi:DNA-directed RNA polymerase subunit alpha|nr:MAG: DNA-directed RNA polymerase subunit alpha [Acidimicrobium sp. BACL27 MAG-120823-bin4]MDA2964234.1 DNA-directed RNA polymerase subunit alpha [Actinomycetota bacterium]MDP4634805.1 DNA-directed RNA polymerase subunit alpha [Ilumatobacteraceae bacterium]HBZ61803.1 DNA-directed RNA polymerase subunit alpha [Acidimicrobium sp.]MDP4694789.1 DNA-directed RNA polymerase subunit alpha [Ilumatobacteraceae bacterium]